MVLGFAMAMTVVGARRPIPLSGWYNGLAHKALSRTGKAVRRSNLVIEYCKAHPGREDHSCHRRRLKDMRVEMGINMK